MNSKQFLDNLSTHLKHVIARSISLATSVGSSEVEPIHMLIALAEEPGSVAAEILKKANFDSASVTDSLRTKVKVPAGKSIKSATLPELNPKAKEVLEKAMLSAYEHEHNYIGTEHVLHGLIGVEDPAVDKALTEQDIKFEDLEDQIHTVFNSVSRFPHVEEVVDAMEHIDQMIEPPPMAQPAPKLSLPPSQKKKTVPKQQTALDLFTIDLTAKDLPRDIDPVIGREREIDRVIHILARRHKNNPVLIGEPGVGKTAIVEGLARRIAAGDVPDILRDKKILALDLTLLLAGTMYRGEFEGRLKHIMDELATREDCILFIDEIHNIIGAGSNQGTMDAANMLKPALARGQLRCIGATTYDEYKKYISNDPALSRRFLSVPVDEPSAEETLAIVTGVKSHFDQFHGTNILPEAIRAAVSLSGRYVHDNFFPDKAIDLIDEAAASVKAKRAIPRDMKRLQALKKTLTDIQHRKESAILSEKYDDAMTFKEKLERIAKELQTLEKKVRKQHNIPIDPVTALDVTRVLANRLNIDPNLLVSDEWASLRQLEKRLKTHLLGQDTVISEVVKTLQQAELRSHTQSKPHASYLFVGPSGVGKTELAKQLAKELYQTPHALIKLDMSEFSEAHGVSKLLGSPAGYVGYKERNRFLDEISKKPYAVVLFDEVDKAHRDVMKLLLQILDEGTLTDSAGKKISFKNAIIVLTANTGSDLFQSKTFGFGGTPPEDQKKELTRAIRNHLKEEFGNALLGRLDCVSIFSPLSETTIEQIISARVEEIGRELTERQHINIHLDATVLPALAKELLSPDTGARNITRQMERLIHEQVLRILSKKTRKKQYTLKQVKGTYRLV